MTSEPSRSTHSDTLSLTGLRGLAALFVLIEHYSVWCAPYDPLLAPGWLWRSLGNSRFGMSLFFTLSGFVIAYNYLALDWGNRAAASVARFAWLRFSRLYPVLLVYLALLYLRPSNYGDQALTAESLLLVSVESFYPFKINGHWLTEPLCWSISTEIALYAIFAVSIIAYRTVRRRFGLSAAAVASGIAISYLATVAWLTWHPEKTYPVLGALPLIFDPIPLPDLGYWFVYWSPYVRFYDFAFGWMAAALVLRGFRLPTWLGDGLVPLCCIALWLAWVSGMFGDGSAVLQPLLPPLFAAIMLAPATSRLSRALSVPVLLFLGEISYSLYLFHPFATNLADHARGQPFSWVGFVDFCGTFALDFVIAIALAAGLYRVIEVPAQKALRRLARRRGAAEIVPASTVSSP